MGCVYYRWQLVFADINCYNVLWLTVITWLYMYIVMIDICLYTWLDLYTRLVTYARLYILTLVVSFCLKISYISFISCSWLSYYPSFQLLCFHFSYHVFIAYVVVMHEHLSLYTHTLIRSLLTTLNSHVQGFGHLPILFRCSCDRTLREELEFLPFDYRYSCHYSWFLYITLSFYSIPYFIWDRE